MSTQAASPPVSSAPSFSTINRDVPAGQLSPIDATGTIVMCLYSSLPAFGLQLDGGASLLFKAGLKLKLAAPFTSFGIDNRTPVAIGGEPLPAQDLSVVLAYGYGDIDDESFLAVVEGLVATDWPLTRTLEGSAFRASAVASPGGGQAPFAMLWNPLGSGTVAFVRRVSASSPAADATGADRICAFLTNTSPAVVGTVTATVQGVSTEAQPYPANTAASVCELAIGTCIANIYPAVGITGAPGVLAPLGIEFQQQRPVELLAIDEDTIALPPGTGVCVAALSPAAAVPLTVRLSWDEMAE